MAGLYRNQFEHDACGVTFVADLKGRRSHRLVSLGIGAVCNMAHRGATGADPETGDGAGILLQVPDRFLRVVTPFRLPPVGRYATGVAFFPGGGISRRSACEKWRESWQMRDLRSWVGGRYRRIRL